MRPPSPYQAHSEQQTCSSLLFEAWTELDVPEGRDHVTDSFPAHEKINYEQQWVRW